MFEVPGIYLQTCESYLDRPRDIFADAEGRIPIKPEALNDLTQGLLDEFVLVYGRGGVGKTDLLINILLSILFCRCVIFFSLELSVRSILKRLLPCISARIEFESSLVAGDFLSPEKMSQEKMANLTRTLNLARRVLSRLTVIEDSAETSPDLVTVEALREVAHSLREQNGFAPAIIVDYTQLVGTRGTAFSTTDAVDRVSRSLASIAHQEETPVIAVSSVGKDGSVRSSSQLQHDPDVILRLSDGDATAPEGARHLVVDVEKNREGVCGERLDLEYWPQHHFIRG